MNDPFFLGKVTTQQNGDTRFNLGVFIPPPINDYLVSPGWRISQRGIVIAPATRMKNGQYLQNFYGGAGFAQALHAFLQQHFPWIADGHMAMNDVVLDVRALDSLFPASTSTATPSPALRQPAQVPVSFSAPGPRSQNGGQ